MAIRQDTAWKGALRSPRRWLEPALLAAVVILVGWFYLWTARPGGNPPALAKDSAQYYNLLTRGILRGHLYLDTPADPFLATLKNPWDAAARGGHGMHDASYYKGRYYIYFGVTPVFALFLPAHVLTGLDVDQALACVIFSWFGFAVSVGLFWAIRKDHFPGAPLWAVAGAAAALGLANAMPILLRRANIWEVPITCAYACFMLALAFLYAALCGKRRLLWMALASGSLGLAVGSRPTYLAAFAALGVPLVYWIRESGGPKAALRSASWRKAALAAALPAAIVGIALGMYNFERFGSFTEFGQRYQMSGYDMTTLTLFNWRMIPYGLRLYWLLPASWSPYFPFVSAADIPPAPAGHLGVEDPYGILPNMPYVILGFWAVPAFFRRRSEWGPLGAFCVACLFAAAATAAFVTAFGGVTNRYMVEFVPAFVLLASVGFLALSSRAGPFRLSGSLLAAALLIYSGAFNVLASFRHNELFRAEHPALYRRMVHRWSIVPYSVDRLLHHGGYGDIELRLDFPANAAGLNEPLIVTGSSFLADYLVVHYEPGNVVSFGLEHTSHRPLFSRPVKLKAISPHILVVGMGSIYPPAGHPYFDSMDSVQASLRQNRLRVTLDGDQVLNTYAEFYDAAHWEPSIGRADTGEAYLRPFSGRLESWRRVAPTLALAGEEPLGSALLSFKLAPFSGVRREPLVCSGAAGRGDLVFLSNLAPGRFTIGFDHWGFGGAVSAPFELPQDAVMVVSIDYGVLHSEDGLAEEPAGGSPGRLVVEVNGKRILDTPQSYYRCDQRLVAIGDNFIGSSMSLAQFSGTILTAKFGDRQP